MQPGAWTWARCLALVSTVIVLLSCGDAGEGTTASTAEAPVSSWRWQGLVIEQQDGTPQACVGEIAPSDPPQCSGWPVSGFDWADVPWLQQYPQSRFASVQLVGHPEDGVFVLDEPPAPQDPLWTPPPCELLDGRSGEAIPQAAMWALIQGPEPAQAGVWLVPGLGGTGGDPAVMGDMSVALVFSTDESIAWLVENLPGRRFQVCPQMYAANAPASVYGAATTTAVTAPPTTVPATTMPLPTVGAVSSSTAVVTTISTTTQP